MLLIAWHRKTFSVLTTLGTWLEVDGVCANNVPIGLHIRERFVDITHLPSGKRIASTNSIGAAMGIVYGIAPLTDWTEHAPVITGEIQDTIALLSGTTFAPRVLS